jgi:hypothetical protein
MCWKKKLRETPSISADSSGDNASRVVLGAARFT